MTTWGSVRDYLLANYEIASERDGQIALDFATEGGRSQRVSIDLEEWEGRSWICISSGFGEVGQVDLERALSLIESRIFGAIGQVGNYYVVKHSAPLEDMNTDERELPMQLTLSLADELEAALTDGDRY